ncbi:MAG: hypothetical protein ACK5MT_18805 [Actinomycetales bacterium]
MTLVTFGGDDAALVTLAGTSEPDLLAPRGPLPRRNRLREQQVLSL